MTIQVHLSGAKGTRTASVTPRPFQTRHIRTGTADTTPLPAITPDLPKNETKPYAPNDPTAVRVYRITPELRRVKVFESYRTDNFDERCQAHADATGCLVQCHDADAFQSYRPTHPIPNEDSPPIMVNYKNKLTLDLKSVRFSTYEIFIRFTQTRLRFSSNRREQGRSLKTIFRLTPDDLQVGRGTRPLRLSETGTPRPPGP